MNDPAANIHQLFPHHAVSEEDEWELSLIERLRSGERNAFDELMKRYQAPVYHVAYRMLGNATEAADATQNVFFKIFEHLAQYESKYRLFSWIYRIAMNESLDQLQQRKRATFVDGALDVAPCGVEDGPEASLDAVHLHDDIQAALMELQQDYRAAIVLRHFSECSYAQMAEILHVPEKT
ncbi:MAG: sigma-70 family RNA polymerase sigma factor, partial [Thermomonas sp.]